MFTTEGRYGPRSSTVKNRDLKQTAICVILLKKTSLDHLFILDESQCVQDGNGVIHVYRGGSPVIWPI